MINFEFLLLSKMFLICNINVNIVFVFFVLNLFNFINPKANIVNKTIPSNHMYVTDITTVNIIANIESVK